MTTLGDALRFSRSSLHIMEKAIDRKRPVDGIDHCEAQAEIGVRQSSEPEVPDTSWVQTILR